MNSTKKGFVLYFNNCRRLRTLPTDQIGLLFLAIMDCAEKEAEGEDGMAGLERRYPDLSPEARMALSFIADNIHRDSQLYREKSANYRAAAQRRSEARREQQMAPDGELRQYVRQLQQNKKDSLDDI